MTSFDSNLARQIEMNKVTLKELLLAGAQLEAPHDLDFWFYGDIEDQGELLASAIRSGFGYKAKVERNGTRFVVHGTAAGMKLSQRVLDEWVTNLCKQGELYDFEFDGWGTEA